ncbi:hypothetical protein BHE74_00030413 [Ensete ventricosum]|uniref:Uncharacterized protein n=1 Tax=Ensete ventricosum TaxID=4639 RepID=A0A426XB67_ENSVE|nr:hypothetical protein B296_00049906 [Ensete ventricosum]RWW03908.1 hypothetical protein GW17_00032903 [Ensete ventricosum]RWW62450.1 hypothetical protein BHE74_00030413 [Ensete ventricosum]
MFYYYFVLCIGYYLPHVEAKLHRKGYTANFASESQLWYLTVLVSCSPLICSKGMLKVPKSSMFGHLSVDKNKLQMREMRRAVSTSHCSQPNTIEYEMAMDWLVIQERSVRCLNALHKGQADELKAIKKRLRTK